MPTECKAGGRAISKESGIGIEQKWKDEEQMAKIVPSMQPGKMPGSFRN